jgi:hypothetical protein
VFHATSHHVAAALISQHYMSTKKMP